MTIHVRECIPGEVASSNGQLCSTCPTATFTFNATARQCYPCPTQATCAGGATLVPLETFWHSAADSDNVVACPNQDACKGDRSVLMACQTGFYNALMGNASVQVLFDTFAVMLSHFVTWCHGSGKSDFGYQQHPKSDFPLSRADTNGISKPECLATICTVSQLPNS